MISPNLSIIASVQVLRLSKYYTLFFSPNHLSFPITFTLRRIFWGNECNKIEIEKRRLFSITTGGCEQFFHDNKSDLRDGVELNRLFFTWSGRDVSGKCVNELINNLNPQLSIRQWLPNPSRRIPSTQFGDNEQEARQQKSANANGSVSLLERREEGLSQYICARGVLHLVKALLHKASAADRTVCITSV